MSKQITINLHAPKFLNVKLYDDYYKVTVSLHISEEQFIYLSRIMCREAKPIHYNGRYYIHWEKSFAYTETPFVAAYAEAETAMRHMKIITRETQINILLDEIDTIKYCE